MLGANRAFQRLVAEKKHNNGELAFSCGGEIVRVKACEFDKVL